MEDLQVEEHIIIWLSDLKRGQREFYEVLLTGGVEEHGLLVLAQQEKGECS